MNLLILVIIIILSVSLSKVLNKHWADPGHIALLYWCSYILAAVLFIGEDYRWNDISLIWIVLICFSYSIGSFLGKQVGVKKKYNKSTNSLSFNKQSVSKHSWNMLVVFIAIGFLRTIYEVSLNGFSISLFFDLDTLLDVNSEMASRRYSGKGINNIVLQLTSVVMYATPLCAGFLINFQEKKSQLVMIFLSFIPVILSLLFTNGKIGLVSSVFLMIIGYIIGYIYKHNELPSVHFRKLAKIGFLIILALIILYFSMILRIGSINSNTLSIVNGKFVNYAFGNIMSFDYWYSYYMNTDQLAYGQFTFVSIFDLLGIVVKEQGVYQLLQGSASNIYTVFRGLFEDFGVFGTFIFMIILGFISGVLFKKLLLGNSINNSSNFFNNTILASIYFFMFFGVFISPWAYTSFILIFPLFYVFLRISKSKQMKG